MSICTVRALPALCLVLAAPASALNFLDISDSAGFTPDHTDQTPAGGISVADFNGNGYPDIFVTGGLGTPNRLYFNQGDNTFQDDPAINAQLAGERCSVTAAADYDNDGWPDLYVGCRWSENHLFRNIGGEGFADVTPEALQHNVPCCSSTRTDAVAWGDLTGNGFLDLYIGIFTGEPDTVPGNLDRIMLNNGDGTWTNAADALDPDALVKPALAVTMSDLDGDGRPDIYVINDKKAGNQLWRNEGPGCGSWCFSDISEASATDTRAYGMGIAIGDVDRDGLWDMYFSSIEEQHLLRGVSRDPLLFSEDTASPLNYDGIGWGTILADFDNDGFEDAYLAVGPEAFAPTDLIDQVFRNDGDGSFTRVTEGSGLDADIPTQAAALIDFDRNGVLDLVLHHWNQSPGYRLYRNTTFETGHWIGFTLEGGAPGVNRDAVGTLITLKMPDGAAQRRELRAGQSRGSSHDRLLHFGLGEATSASVTVRWPDGCVQRLGSMPQGAYHHLVHPRAGGSSGRIHGDRFETECE
ncbi:MAG: hypothetical protein GVY32_08700 [Gammaproteobacteria bacterium]|jgi:hypothetical protein|nr:hypothetical protein [Gammaproteobacteria bacterium]